MCVNDENEENEEILDNDQLDDDYDPYENAAEWCDKGHMMCHYMHSGVCWSLVCIATGDCYLDPTDGGII